jgi:hypothetical protein
VIKNFPTKTLQELLWEEETDGLTVISDEMSDKARWTIGYDLTFREESTGKFYQTYYRKGATENCDEQPFEFEGFEVACYEVEPKTVQTIIYVPVEA